MNSMNYTLQVVESTQTYLLRSTGHTFCYFYYVECIQFGLYAQKVPLTLQRPRKDAFKNSGHFYCFSLLTCESHVCTIMASHYTWVELCCIITTILSLLISVRTWICTIYIRIPQGSVVVRVCQYDHKVVPQGHHLTWFMDISKYYLTFGNHFATGKVFPVP